MPYIGSSYYSQPIDSNVYDWARATGYANADGVRCLSNFVSNLKTNDIWNKINYLYPFMTDKTDNAGARAQFSYNLVTPTSGSVATYLNNKSTGSIDGYKNAGSDTFVTPIRGETELSASYHIMLYTTSSVAATDQIDLGTYDGGSEFIYLIMGRNSNQLGCAINGGNTIFPANTTYTGLQTVQGKTTGTLSEYYVRKTRYSNGSYNSTLRGNFKIGIGSFLQTNTSALSATTKTYQFASFGQWLEQYQVNIMNDLVNDLQKNLDYVLGSKRFAP